MTYPSSVSRRGFSLLELMIALVLFSVVMGGALSFMVQQSKGLRLIAEKSDGVQNGRFSRDLLRQELRTAGTNVTDVQPIIVLANDSAFGFNADLTTGQRDSVALTGAVYVDEFAPPEQLTALTVDRQITVRGSNPGLRYPLQNYSQAAAVFVNSDAELITFWFAPDSTDPKRSYALWRQVNGAMPEMVAAGLTRNGATPFFRYHYDAGAFSSKVTGLQLVPSAWLPLIKAVPRRGLDADTGTAVSRRIDAVRAVEVTYEATAPKGGPREVVRYVVPLPNVAHARQARACGRVPLVPSTPGVTWRADSQFVQLVIPRAIDDGAGERDVIRYVLWRQQVGSTTWGQPISTIGATQAGSYTVRDAGHPVRPAVYRYAIAVQDCTPNLSGLAISAPISIPASP